MTFLIYGERLPTVIIVTQDDKISFKGEGVIAEVVDETIRDYKENETEQLLIDELQTMCEDYGWEMVAY